jgi:hypothetical protein
VRSLEINETGSSHTRATHDELDAAMYRVLGSSPVPLDITLDDGYRCQMSYDHKSRFRTVCKGSIGYYCITYLGLNATYNWLQTQKTSQLSIVDINDLQLPYFQPLFSQSLRHLSIFGASLSTERFNRNLWSAIIEIISGLSGLRYCEIEGLIYRLNLDWDYDAVSRVNLILPGHGHYPYLAWDRHLSLRFPDGTSKVKVDGGDTCRKLQEIASYARAAENSKRQMIISDGCVKDAIVKGIHEIEV